jgi:hypothetical protein
MPSARCCSKRSDRYTEIAVRTAASLFLPAVFLLAATSLDDRLARWRPVEMPFDAASLTARERALVEKLVDACRYFDSIYWRQSDPEGLELFRRTTDPKLRRLLGINGSRFDLVDGNAPFAGSDPISPGHGLYPKGLTREEIERYVNRHPERRAQIYSPYTVVKRQGGELVGVPYHVEYRHLLEPAAQRLREAAALSGDPAFARFLELRAVALLTDDYYASDLAWLDLKAPGFDVIFAPYETYLDDVLGVKTSYGAAVLVRNDAQSRSLALYERYIPDLQDALPLAPEDRPSKIGHLTPMEVADSPFRAGDLRYGYQAVADNLPNDPKIHEEKGSKKIFFKNFLDARVSFVILPIAKRLMPPGQAAEVSGDGYLAGTILHEIAHGLGPAWARRGGARVDIREAIGPLFSALEEAKADAVGLFGLEWLTRRGVLPKERLNGYYASQVAGLLRTMRFSTAEAHGQSELMQFNYFTAEGVVAYDRQAGRYAIDYARMPAAVAKLAKELLETEAAGDQGRAERWFARYAGVSRDLRTALSTVSAVPVDIEPVFSFRDRIE